jgi:hypothetical protein
MWRRNEHDSMDLRSLGGLHLNFSTRKFWQDEFLIPSAHLSHASRSRPAGNRSQIARRSVIRAARRSIGIRASEYRSIRINITVR